MSTSETHGVLPADLVKWFGESWGAPVCAPEDKAPLPDAPCAACEERFEAHDHGVILPFLGGPGDPTELPYHLACFCEALGIGRGSTG